LNATVPATGTVSLFQEIIPMSAIASRNGNNASPSAGNGESNDGFLKFLPAVKLHAQIQFRHLPHADREEAIAESIASAFCNYVTACKNGKGHVIRPSTLAHYSVLNAKAGRHVGGPWESKRDALSHVAQRKHRFRVFRLPVRDGYAYDCMAAPDQAVWRDRLLFDRRTPPPDQAALRIDLSSFLARQHDRTRTLLAMLAAGYKQAEAADHLGVTAPAITQRRNRAAREWAVFQGEADDDSVKTERKATTSGNSRAIRS
jgi:hypothetical protein